MNSQFGNHNYDKEYEEYLIKAIAQASPELKKKAEDYGWSRETLAAIATGECYNTYDNRYN